MTKRPPVIVYHADCIDGVAAAWVVTKALGIKQKTATGDALFIPYDHAAPHESENNIRAALENGSAIYFADISPEKPFLDELVATGKDIHIFDHHKTAAPTLKTCKAPNLHICFDPAAPSAAGLVWRHFYPKQKLPDVIGLIDLMDGAAAGLKTPQDFAAAALVDAHNIQTPKRALDTLRGLAKLSFNAMAKRGAGIAADQHNKIDALLAQVPTVWLELLPETQPLAVPIINGNPRHYGRGLSPRLVDCARAHNAPAALMWSLQKNGTVSLSIRTDGTPDAGEIAKHLCKLAPDLTGGGHKDAAVVHFPSLFCFARLMPIKPAKPGAPFRPEPPSPY